MRLLVSSVTVITDRVRAFALVDPTGRPLPSYTPGSHIGIGAGEGRTNAYSLTGDGVLPREYTISVQREATGRGGSDWLHRELHTGDEVDVTGPFSAFAPVAHARSSLLVAAGIGATPILSHARALARWGRPFTVVLGHSRDHAPHRDDLATVAGDRFVEAVGREAVVPALTRALAEQPTGSYAYACGSAAFLTTFLGLAAALGWPAERLRTERFDAPEPEPGERFDVELRRSGRRLGVAAGASLLDALDGAGVVVPRLCRRGVCGQCEVPVASGDVLHRDLVLGPDERERNDRMLSCVSRGVADTLVLDL